MLQKSSAEQKRAKSQASAGGCAPSPCMSGRLRRKASAEKVVWTWRSPNRICLAVPSAPSVARAATAAGGTVVRVISPGASCRPRQPATSNAASATRDQCLMASPFAARHHALLVFALSRCSRSNVMDFLRTPDDRFASLPAYPFAPQYVEVDGLRIHCVDEG